MTDRPDAFAIPDPASRSKLSPPVFPPGCYRAASRRAQGREPAGPRMVDRHEAARHGAAEDAGDSLPGAWEEDPTEPDLRPPEQIAEALESLSRELRRRGGEALRSSPGAPRLEADLRQFVARFLAEAPSGI